MFGIRGSKQSDCVMLCMRRVVIQQFSIMELDNILLVILTKTPRPYQAQANLMVDKKVKVMYKWTIQY